MIYTYNEMLEKYKSDYQIKKAIMNCKVFKLNKGIYSDTSFVNDLEILSKKYPYGIIASNSAYFYYDLTDVIPNRVSIATNRKTRMIKDNEIKQIRVRDDLYELGKTKINYEGVDINIYDKERLLVDLARNKNKMQYDLYKEIVKNYRKISNSLNVRKIEEYIKYFANSKKIFEIIQDEVF